jgi:hypothetical protein
MNPATILLSSSVASHSSSFCSLLNKCGASDSYRNYPNTELLEVERSLRSPFLRQLSICLAIFFSGFSLLAQNSASDTILVSPGPGIKRNPIGIHDRINNIYPNSINKKRQWLIGGINVVGYGGSLIVLNNAWYKGYARTGFHTFNDSKEWLQVDKIGHGWTAYNAGKASAAMWKWAGLSNKKAAWIGALSSTAFLTGIEFLDAHSAKWGWSWSDIGANFIGSGFFVGQEALWNEQRIQYKFSFHKKTYSEAVLETRADNLFGKSWYERMLKDYNAQTYWFSANLKSFLPKSNLPAWLNISFGYGADGMFGGFENKWTDGDPGFPINRTGIPRKRQFYLAPDIDFTKIKTNKKWLKTVFTFLNAFKCPAPALMIDSKGKFRAYAIYF